MKEMDPVGGGGTPAAPPPRIRQCIFKNCVKFYLCNLSIVLFYELGQLTTTKCWSIEITKILRTVFYVYLIRILDFWQLSLAKLKSLACWLSRLENQRTKLQKSVYSCKNQGTIIHFNVTSKTLISVFSYESTISCMLVFQPAQLAC